MCHFKTRNYEQLKALPKRSKSFGLTITERLCGLGSNMQVLKHPKNKNQVY